MENFNEQPFYNRLNEKLRNKVQDLINTKNTVFFYRVIEWVCWCTALFVIFINLKTFEDNNGFVKSVTVIAIAGGLIIIPDMLIKIPKKNLNKSKEKLQKEMLFDICTCSKRCTCRNELREYLNKIHIDLFTKEE